MGPNASPAKIKRVNVGPMFTTRISLGHRPNQGSWAWVSDKNLLLGRRHTVAADVTLRPTMQPPLRKNETTEHTTPQRNPVDELVLFFNEITALLRRLI